MFGVSILTSSRCATIKTIVGADAAAFVVAATAATVVICSFFHQVFCLFLFLAAVSLFGTIIAELNEIIHQLRIKSKGLDEILEAYLDICPRL